MYRRNFSRAFQIFLLSLPLIMSGCSRLTPPPKLTLDELKNAKYLYVTDEYVQFTDGAYVDRNFLPATPTLRLWEQPIAFADLNADGLEDAVVILEYSGGGSGRFMFLVVVLNENGKPVEVAKAGLGDRTKINSIQIEDNIITLKVLAHGPDDGLCCPKLNATWQWRFEENQLIPLE